MRCKFRGRTQADIRTFRVDSSGCGRSGNGHDSEEGEDSETHSAKILQRMNLVMVYFVWSWVTNVPSVLCGIIELLTSSDLVDTVHGFGIMIAAQISQQMFFLTGSREDSPRVLRQLWSDGGLLYSHPSRDNKRR
jgi:hypothetical protein